MQINIVTAPSSAPVTTADAKLDLRVDHDSEDTIIAGLIATATAEAENIARRALVTQTIDIAIDAWPVGRFYIPRPPLQSITWIKYYDQDNQLITVDPAIYLVIGADPGFVCLANNCTWPAANLRAELPIVIRAVVGYGAAAAVPDRYQHAIRALVAIDYENRDALKVDSERARARIIARLRMDQG